jgi:hypothetical protein
MVIKTILYLDEFHEHLKTLVTLARAVVAIVCSVSALSGSVVKLVVVVASFVGWLGAVVDPGLLAPRLQANNVV